MPTAPETNAGSSPFRPSERRRSINERSVPRKTSSALVLFTWSYRYPNFRRLIATASAFPVFASVLRMRNPCSSSLSNRGDGEIPPSKANSVRTRRPNPWIVEMYDSSSFSASSIRSRFTSSNRIRSFNSDAAASVNVTARIRSGATSPLTTQSANCVWIRYVFPDPAPAGMTVSRGIVIPCPLPPARDGRTASPVDCLPARTSSPRSSRRFRHHPPG